MSKAKDFNYDNFKPKDKTSGSITLTPKTKEDPIGPRPPHSPRPRITLIELNSTVNKLASTVDKLAKMFIEFREEQREYNVKFNSRLENLENKVDSVIQLNNLKTR